jgi:hypothetical protein
VAAVDAVAARRTGWRWSSRRRWVLDGGADAGEAPGLIDPPVDDDVGHAEAEAVARRAGAVDGEGVVRLMTPFWAQKLVMLASIVPPLRLTGSSSESEPEKPLPNWAV